MPISSRRCVGHPHSMVPVDVVNEVTPCRRPERGFLSSEYRYQTGGKAKAVSPAPTYTPWFPSMSLNVEGVSVIGVNSQSPAPTPTPVSWTGAVIDDVNVPCARGVAIGGNHSPVSSAPKFTP